MEKVSAKIDGDNYKTIITTSRSQFVSDMSQEEGGMDAGPKPKELLGAALAGCVTMTVKMYAKRSNWPLDEVLVDVEVDTDTTPGTTVFRKKVSFTGDLTEEQIKRLHIIASKCPINKLLQNPITVETL